MEKYNLTEVSTYAHGVGPDVVALLNDNFLEKAKDAGLLVHPWYVRDEQLDYTNNPINENTMFITEYRVDGLFTEYPHMTLTTFDLFLTN